MTSSARRTTTQPGKVLALCADDYGQAPAADAATLKLAQQRRLSEVSCLVTGSALDKDSGQDGGQGWPQAARALAALPAVRQGHVRTGLHFNLSLGRPLSPSLRALWPQFPGLQDLIVMAHLRRLPLAALHDELHAQLQAFEQARGRAPAHVAGHQHVHHLPGVREVVMAQLSARADIRVRHTGRVQGPGYAVKRLLIEGTGGRELGRRLQAAARHANTHLYGVYDFARSDYRSLVQGWLAALPEAGALLVCHPGVAAEAAYLGSDDFAADLQAASVKLA